MKITKTFTKEVDVKYLSVVCQVRYWEDSTVNGVEDTDGDLIPCRCGDNWEPVVELETGQIINWKEGHEASIHYKVCDAGAYALLDKDKDIVAEIDGYVPDIMCPKGEGYGDYIIMDISADGIIQNWNPSLNAWQCDDE